uniref:Uncharacterized protein n=2 Tax=Aegilops tauschii subsp. strangulata TaxID=200361 RepID=A0A453RQ44_AEGTS
MNQFYQIAHGANRMASNSASPYNIMVDTVTATLLRPFSSSINPLSFPHMSLVYTLIQSLLLLI